MWQIHEAAAQSILSPTSGFIREAGFTHSLTPARNCTYGCAYCYVPTMGIYGGLKPVDWQHWGQWTTFKSNAAELLASSVRAEQVIYCSPLVDPYQPAERTQSLMPRILRALMTRPPRVFVLQTRGPCIIRDLSILKELSSVTKLRISFSVTTDKEDVRRRYEPHCEPNVERIQAIEKMVRAGLEVYATLAPLLPCDPRRLAQMALNATHQNIIGDPLHIRQLKPRGATTRAAAIKIATRYHEERWFEPNFQSEVVQTIEAIVNEAGRKFVTGPAGFGLLAR